MRLNLKMMLCLTCGNTVESGRAKCTFCDADIENSTGLNKKPITLHKRLNLEYGRPVVESALKRMHNELEQAKIDSVRVVTLIHGYGSSGKGGKIRIECRKSLDYLLQKGVVKNVVHGENLHKRSGIGKAMIRQYPDLEQLCKSDFNNQGITLVEF